MIVNVSNSILNETKVNQYSINMSNLHKELLQNTLPTRPVYPNASKSRFSGLVPKRNVKDYSASCWSSYFEKEESVRVRDDVFKVYKCGTSGPVILLLHGGGHSALSWAIFTKVLRSICECQTVAIDFRGHGSTITNNDDDLSVDTLSKDVGSIIESLYSIPAPPIILMGHSMGGAIAVHVAVKQLIPSLRGLVVIDVVEGTALDSLSSMQSFIRSRPQRFRTMEEGIEWSIRSGQLKNIESAKISMTGQLIKINSVQAFGLSSVHPTNMDEEMSSDENNIDTKNFCMEKTSRDGYKWRVDLSKSEPYWKGWFENMSSLFLSCNVPKLLILAGVDRLDKELTIAQMQGKFQMQILRNCGHMVHEDVPEKVAEILAEFLFRQQLTVAKRNFGETCTHDASIKKV